MWSSVAQQLFGPRAKWTQTPSLLVANKTLWCWIQHARSSTCLASTARPGRHAQVASTTVGGMLGSRP
jgi:hypothetical protein